MKRTTMALWAVTLAVLVGTAARANDEQIATQIIQRLQQQQQASKLEGFNIGVQVEQGTVTVMGTVSQTEHALLALDVARRVPGVKLVVNDLFVQPASTAAQASQTVTPAAALTVADKSPAVTAPSGTPIQGLELAQPTPPLAPAAPSMAVAASPGMPTNAIGTGLTAAPQRPAPSAPLAIAAAQPTAPPRAVAETMAAAPRASKPMRQKPVAFAPSTAVAAQQASFNVAPEYQQAARAQYAYESAGAGTSPVPMGAIGGGGVSQASYDNPQMPGYAWPSYAAYPNYAALTYPHQYSATAWPYIGPFYPYPQVPLGWRKVTLEWDDGWWFLDFKSKTKH